MPVPLTTEFGLDSFIKDRVRKGYETETPMSSGRGSPHQGYCLLYVVPGFTGISELQEITSANPGFLQPLTSVHNLFDQQPLVHCVEDLLRPRFDAHPHFRATSAMQRSDGFRRHQVSPRLNFERHGAISTIRPRARTLASSGDSEQIRRRQTRLLRPILLLQLGHLVGDRLSLTHVEPIARDRLGAPIASIRTTAARNHIQGKIAVSSLPGLPIRRQIDQVTRGLGRLTHDARREQSLLAAGRILPSEPVRASPGIPSRSSLSLRNADTSFAEDLPLRPAGRNCSVLQIFFRVVSGIGAMDDYGRSRSGRPRIICHATSRIRVRHIFDRKLKSSS